MKKINNNDKLILRNGVWMTYLFTADLSANGIS